MSFQQLNVCWSKLAIGNRIWDRFRGWKESHNLAVAYNKWEQSKTYFQPGGAAVVSVNKITHAWESSGVDDTKLGRWSWIRFQGSHGRHLRVVSLYRPVRSETYNSAYMQQLRYSMLFKKGLCPREVLLQDLQEQILQWKSTGDGLLIMGDFNEDVGSPTLSCWKERLGLKDALLERLGEDLLGPATYQRGKKTIDTILCTPGIEIRKSGYLPFGEGVGDHRPIFVDVTVASTLGVNLPPPRQVKARRLKLNDPRVVNKYNKSLNEFFSHHALFHQVQLLQENITRPLSEDVAKEYERLDRIRIKGMQYAEKHCRKLKMGVVPWTPELSKIRLRIEVWQLVLKRLLGCSISSRTILRKKNRAGMKHVKTEVTEAIAREMIGEEFICYKKYLEHSKEKRQAFLHTLAQAKAKEGKMKIARQIKMMEQQERQRLSAARTRRMNGSARSAKGLAKVVITDDEGVEVEVNDKDLMEKILLESYEATLTQSNLTPCTVSPLKEKLGATGEGVLVNDILLGNVSSLSGVDDVTVEVLKYLTLKDGTHGINKPQPLLVEECQEGWKLTKERLASAMAEGTHFGHWKAGHIDKDIAAVHTCFANVPYLSGYAPDRWKYGVNTLIPKEEGNYRVKRLRTILLYEADFNFNNKLLGRRMMKAAEEHGVLAGEQYGSRKAKSARDCALNKRLMFDILRQLKRPAGLCSCDLQSCYDRIVHAFASMAMQRAGAPTAAVESMFTTIQHLKHVVRTCHGISTQSFGGESWREINPLQGVGQGNGAAPAIWAVISSVFFDLLKDKGYGFKMRAPLSRLAIHLAGCGFVDDTDLFQIGLEEDDYTVINQKLQEAVKWWEVCANVSGGAVVPSKSWYGIIEFEWIDGEWHYATDLQDVQLLIKDSAGEQSPLKLLAPHEAKRMLGVFLAIDGSNDIQVQHMRRVAEEWHDKIRTGHLTREDAWIALNSTILKTLEYPLMATTLTQSQCDFIMAPILQGGLSKMGVCKNLPRALVYGPNKYLGMGIDKLYTTQGIAHIKAVLDHAWKLTTTGKLLRTSVEIAKVEIGLRGSLWSYDYKIYGHLCEDTWVKHLWEFLWDNGIRIDDDVADFDFARERDSCINEGLARAYIKGEITKAEWCKANKCRLYLQCLTLGDIASGDGKSIEANVMKGIWSDSRARDITWPTQGKPKSTDWVVWRRLIKKIYLTTTKILSQPLGNWLSHVGSLYKGKWEWWWETSHHSLLRCTNGQWYRYTSSTNTRKRNASSFKFKYYTMLADPPDENLLLRTSVQLVNGFYMAQGCATITNPQRLPTTTVPSIQGLVDVLQSRKGESWAVQAVMTTTDISSLVTDIIQGTAVGVSDGSFKDSMGTAAWILENEAGTQRIQGKVIVPGHASVQNAYRSELAGLYGLVYVLEMISSIWNISTGSVTIGCDGKSALTQAVTSEKYASSGQQHFDLISGIQGYIHRSSLTYNPVHVKGHQDEKFIYEDLDRLELLNIECDNYAKEYWAARSSITSVLRKEVINYNIPYGIWKVSLHGTRVCTNLIEDMRESIEGGVTAEYWINKKKRFAEDGYFRVDWPAVKQAMKSVPIWRKHWVTKFSSGFCSTGRMMYIWKQRLIDTCPRCGMEVETTDHILRCTNVDAVSQWDDSLLKLNDWMTSVRTCPDIRVLLHRVLGQWKAQTPVTPPTTYDFDGILRIYKDQQNIGWRNLVGGCLSVEWARVQDDYYKWLGIQKTGKRWVEMLIVKLWDVAWDQWQHRNKVLHHTPLAADMSGAVSLDIAIKAECSLGSQGLPLQVRCTFPRDVNRLLHAPLHERKCWLLLVRASRELVNDNRICDEFSNSNSYLRNWVGLNASK